MLQQIEQLLWLHLFQQVQAIMIDWLIDWIEIYAVSAIFQPCNGGNGLMSDERLTEKMHIIVI